MKGSRYEIIKLVESSNFIDIMNDFIKSEKAKITVYDNWLPKSLHYDKEAELKHFLKYNYEEQKGKDIENWWLMHSATTPVWDLISTCTINGKKGLLLVEAKAHSKELKEDDKCSSNNSDNLNSIKSAIAQANSAINDSIASGEVLIERDACYQLSNRVAHAWWLANQGIPVILMYLGFLNCEVMKDNGNIFKEHSDWLQCFKDYSTKVGIDKIIDQPIDCGESQFKLICRSI